ncbi:MAG: YdeI/OmpD-associated family protein [Actinomycetota bacterium]|nr:YdeI/OmpD-associated family protein [Actinomycetota bacterium]
MTYVLAGGDAISVELAIDSAPRAVEAPADLATALATAGATATFDALTPSLQKAHVVSVTGAKTDATGERRLQAVVTKVTGA